MRIYTHFSVSYWVFTGEMSLSRDGAVGARVIQASAHVRLGGGGAVKLLPSACDLAPTQVGGDLSPEGGGFARDRTKPAEFLAPLTALFHLVVPVSFHASCLKS
jgi:hypothetical protein